MLQQSVCWCCLLKCFSYCVILSSTWDSHHHITPIHATISSPFLRTAYFSHLTLKGYFFPSRHLGLGCTKWQLFCMHVKQKGATIGPSFILSTKSTTKRKKKCTTFFDHGNGNKNFYFLQTVAMGIAVFNRILGIKCLGSVNIAYFSSRHPHFWFVSMLIIVTWPYPLSNPCGS